MQEKLIIKYSRKFLSVVSIGGILALSGCTQAPAPIVDAGGIIGPSSDQSGGVDMGSGFTSEEISSMINNPEKYTSEQRDELANKIANVMKRDNGNGNVFYFDFNRNKLSPSSKVKANLIAQLLSEYPDQHVRIAGNTDPIGSENYNFSLGQRRAMSVDRYLRSQGVSAKQICTVSYGSNRSIVSTEMMTASRCSLKAGKPTATSACKKAFKSDRRAVVVFGGICKG